MRYQLLGPLAAADGDGPIAIGSPKQRRVLAHLLLNLNRTVPADNLIDAVWGEEPPETARGTLQTYVSRLRSTFGPEGTMTKQLLSRARRRRALAREANVYLVIIAGPARHEETIMTAEVDLTKARTERNWSTRWATTIARISSGLP